MTDPMESTRLEMIAKINADPGSRASLEERHGQVWDTQELQEEFTVEGFLAPFIVVQRKSDQQRGTMIFQHSPRFYYSFHPDN